MKRLGTETAVDEPSRTPGGNHLWAAPVSIEATKLRAERDLAYSIRRVALDQDLSSVIQDWRECNEDFQDHTIICDPEWIQERVKSEKANIQAYLVETDRKVVGAVPLEFYPHRLTCKLGDLTLARVPIKMCRILGYTPNLPEEELAHDLFFRQLLGSDFDAIYMTCVRGDSFFWRYLHTSPLIKKHFFFYSERGLRPHPVVRITGSFDDYNRKLSSKARNNFSRHLRKLKEKGSVELVKVKSEQEVDSFVEVAAEISRKTYQFRVLGIGIRNSDQLKEWLKWAARQGWLRSYLLKCGGTVVAFQIGYQYNEKFLGVEIGFDPAWSKLGVGVIQQLLALEDLFKDDPPSACDFGGYADYKQHLANDAYADALVWLFRKRPYPFLALSTYRLFSAASMKIGSLLEQLNLKSKVRQLIRG